MFIKPRAVVQALCFFLLLLIVPGTAAPQEQPAPPVQQNESTAPAEQPPLSSGTLTIPKAGSAEPEAAMPAAEAAPSAGSAAETAPAGTKATEYIIKKGDTLWDIANAFLRDPFLWPFIWKANTYIANPDLIYPGNTLVIPSLAPIERAMEAPPETAPMPEKAPPPEQKAAEAPRTPPPPAEQPEEEAPAQVGRLIMPEEKPRPIIDKYSMLSAGFINDEESVGEIVGARETGKTTLGYDDVVYVKIKSPEDVKVGDKYLIYEPLQKIKHPVTGELYGRLIRGLGILEITDKDPSADVLTARITLSFFTTQIGSLLTPYQEPALIYQPSTSGAKDISGYILATRDQRSIVGQGNVVYLDRGREDGVDPGDEFTVYERPEKPGFPRKKIGDVIVFLVKERTSTAVVLLSTNPMSIGDMIDFKR